MTAEEHSLRRRRWSELRSILDEWDSIGILQNADAPRDEYDCLTGPLLRLLEDSATTPELVAFLRAEIAEQFGLNPEHHDFEAIARRVKTWFEASYAGS